MAPMARRSQRQEILADRPYFLVVPPAQADAQAQSGLATTLVLLLLPFAAMARFVTPDLPPVSLRWDRRAPRSPVVRSNCRMLLADKTATCARWGAHASTERASTAGLDFSGPVRMEVEAVVDRTSQVGKRRPGYLCRANRGDQHTMMRLRCGSLRALAQSWCGGRGET
jgi:hypothetical protein